MERSKQNRCVDDNNGDGAGNSDDNGDKHLTHLSPAVDCCLTKRSDPNMCVDDGKEGVDNSDDSDDKHLTHLTQAENNVNLGVCDKHLTHATKNTPESLINDVTSHATHVNFFRKMSVSKKVILQLKGGGLKDDHDFVIMIIRIMMKKIMKKQTIKVLIRGCLLVLQQ